MYLVHKDIDGKIGALLMKNCNIVSCKILNEYMNIFKDYGKLIDALYKSFISRFCQYYKIDGPEYIFSILKFIKINTGSFYTKALADFGMQKDVIMFNEGQSAKTRRTLYMLGIIFGYRYTISKQERCEKTYTYRSGYMWAEDKIDKDGEYTMRQLNHLKVDWGNDYNDYPSWLPTGRFAKSGEELWKFNPEACFYKRGVMVNGPGVLRFYKANVISTEQSNRCARGLTNYLILNKKEKKKKK